MSVTDRQKQIIKDIDLVKSHAPYINNLVRYINREIEIHEVQSDKIRNMNDALAAILFWNNHIDEVISSHYPYIQKARHHPLSRYQVDNPPILLKSPLGNILITNIEIEGSGVFSWYKFYAVVQYRHCGKHHVIHIENHNTSLYELLFEKTNKHVRYKHLQLDIDTAIINSLPQG